MRVLMVLFGKYPPDPRIRKEVKALIEAGHDVRILCSMTEDSTVNIGGAEVVGFSRWKTNPVLSKQGLRKAYSVLLKNTNPDVKRRIEKEVKENNIDVVHVHDIPPAKSALSATDVPIILDLHENYYEAVRQYRSNKKLLETAVSNPKSALYQLSKPAIRYKRIQRLTMKRADHVLAVVQEAKEAYKKSGIESEKITIVSNTVDTDWFDRYSSGYEKYDTDEFMITYSGGLSGHHRGLDTAVKSQPIINSEIRDAKLRMAGGGPLEENLKNLAQRLNIKENIEFTGWVDFTELPKYVRAADVGIVPHRSNPHTNTTVPHKLFHYMASGIPVIVTETDAVARIVRETNSGLVVPPEDSEAFAEAAVELADSDRRTELGENGRDAVEKKYNWGRDAERLREVYKKI